ncbi:MAG: efflux RND transporter periplasmic adaptor subunit [Bacteroidota bacterium]
MKRFTVISIMVVVVGVVVAILMTGTTTSNAQTGNTIATAYSVSVISAQLQNINENFSLVGTIAAYNDVVILSETNGRVVKVNAEVGEYKPAGSVLVEVDDELKEAAYKAASTAYEKAKKDLERYEALYKEGSIAEAQIEQARWNFQNTEAQFIVARRQYRDTKITTPISGIVTARPVNIGTMVQGAPQPTVVANVVDISKLKVKVNVAENDVFKIKAGDNVEITTDVYPGVIFEGRVATIAAKGDDAHTYPVEVILNNSSKHPLKAGMFGRVSFSPKMNQQRIVIPREAIVGGVRNAKVYIVENNSAKLRSIIVGKEIGTNVEVLSGITVGDVVVVNGQNNLKDNVPVTVRN